MLCATCLCVAACAPVTGHAGFAFLGKVQFPTGFTFDGTTVGGLSGISYDPGGQVYYVISDDRSQYNPARFYTVRISLSDNKLGDVDFIETHPWLDREGRPYPRGSVDPEGIAFDGRRRLLYWSSEVGPRVFTAGLDGGDRGEFALPPTLAGARPNNALEGLTLTPSGRFVWAAMEEPGYNDGQPPTADEGALTWITKFDADSGAVAAQYAYPLDPITAPAGEANGLSELVALDDDTFLVVERSHGARNVARIYRARVNGASDVVDRPSLRDAPVTPMSKALVADLSTMPEVQPLDNVEGITLGPVLPDGRQSVVLVTDNNFSATQVTQFLAFAL